MEKKTVDVKSKGEVIGKVVVNIYANMGEAEKDLGAKKTLEMINAQHKANVTNEYRASKTMSKSATAQLKTLGDKDPKIKAQIDGLLAKLQKDAAGPQTEAK